MKRVSKKLISASLAVLVIASCTLPLSLKSKADKLSSFTQATGPDYTYVGQFANGSAMAVKDGKTVGLLNEDGTFTAIGDYTFDSASSKRKNLRFIWQNFR